MVMRLSVERKPLAFLLTAEKTLLSASKNLKRGQSKILKGVSHGLLTFYETVFFGASRQTGSPDFCSPSGQAQSCDFK